MLDIQKLQIKVDAETIVSDLDLKILPGEIHCIMGPNGSGKSTLVNALMAHPKYEVQADVLEMEAVNLLELETFERARLGLFLAQQYPREIAGLNFLNFLTAAYNGMHADQEGFKPARAFKLKRQLEPILQKLGLDKEFLNRYLNLGFSGGEKKKAEILQLNLLQPKLALLDETDSGLDVDALKIVAQGVQDFMTKDRGVLIVTHYQRILGYLRPDYVHVLIEGRLVKSGKVDLAQKIEKQGFNWLR